MIETNQERFIPEEQITGCQRPGRFPQNDRVQLQQVFLNLLLNAFEAVKDAPARERKVIVRAEANVAGRAEISVRDHGAGLTSDGLVRIFQPFYTTKRDGLGMGLSISRSIIEAHGGRPWAKNNAERGATFISPSRWSAKPPSLLPWMDEPLRVRNFSENHWWRKTGEALVAKDATKLTALRHRFLNHFVGICRIGPKSNSHAKC